MPAQRGVSWWRGLRWEGLTREAAVRAAGVDARPLGLQRQVADQPVLVAVREHLAARVEADLVRDTARSAAPLPARHQRRRVLCDAVVDGEHGARRPSGVVVALILDGARDAVADAEAARLGRTAGGSVSSFERRRSEGQSCEARGGSEGGRRVCALATC